jgi:hypothetical protein
MSTDIISIPDLTTTYTTTPYTTTVIPSNTTMSTTSTSTIVIIIVVIIVIIIIIGIIWYFVSKGNSESGTISIDSATFGQNCNKALSGNATDEIITQCNNKTDCIFKVDTNLLSDASPGCNKNLIISYACSNYPNNKYDYTYYQGDNVNFNCDYNDDKIYVTQASYASNCDDNYVGNSTRAVQQLCDGKDSCNFQVKTSSFGLNIDQDDIGDCIKEMSITYRCGSNPDEQTITGVVENDIVNFNCNQ